MADDQTNPQAAGVEAPSIEARLNAIYNREPRRDESARAPEQAQQETAGEADAAEVTVDDLPSEDGDSPQAAGQPDDAEFVEIVHNGQQRKLSRQETIELASKGFDYTQKTQAVAAREAAVNEALSQAQQVMQLQVALAPDLAQVHGFRQALQPYANVDWVALAKDDPLAYSQHRAQFDQLREAAGRAEAQLGQKAQALMVSHQQASQAMLQQEAARLQELMPQWRDPKRYAQDAKAMTDYGLSQGYRAEELAGIADARMVRTLWKAQQYDKLVSQKSEKLKQMRGAAPMAQPGASEPQQSVAVQRIKQDRQRLKKTGDWRDAASLLSKLK